MTSATAAARGLQLASRQASLSPSPKWMLGVGLCLLALQPTRVAFATKPPSPRGIDPYPYVYGGRQGAPVPSSPDPLAGYTWDLDGLGDAATSYQVFHDVAVTAAADPAAAVVGVQSITNATADVAVRASALITLKFAQEGACWLEFDSPDLAASSAVVTLGISENKLVAPLETHPPVRHNDTYRLESNRDLYEGVRYAFINVTGSAFAPWHITAVRRVCQVVPTNYAGGFRSSDPDLDRIWWTGAYTTRVTLVGNGITAGPGYLGSELMNRGDRIAFLGDAHVAQATAIVAFGNFHVLASSNNYT